MGRLSTELILVILGACANSEFLLQVRGSTRDLRRLATMDLLWVRHWVAIDAVTQAEARSQVPASVSQVHTHSPLFCLTL